MMEAHDNKPEKTLSITGAAPQSQNKAKQGTKTAETARKNKK